MASLGSHQVELNDAEIDALLNDPAGPVGQLIWELSTEAAGYARGAVRVRDPATRNRHRRAGHGSSAWPPGYTLDSIEVHEPRIGSRGGLYGGVNTAFNPGYFLERPARQMDRRYPFMTSALDELAARY